MNKECAGEPVEANIVAEMPLMDLPGGCGLTEAVGRQRVELTRTAIRAITIREFVGAHTPFDCRHIFLPAIRKFPVMVLSARLRSDHAKPSLEDSPLRRMPCW